jgi:hypothetical protein
VAGEAGIDNGMAAHIDTTDFMIRQNSQIVNLTGTADSDLVNASFSPGTLVSPRRLPRASIRRPATDHADQALPTDKGSSRRRDQQDDRIAPPAARVHPRAMMTS